MKSSSYWKAVSSAAVVVIVLGIGMVAFESYVSDLSPGLALTDGKLSDAQKESLVVMLDLVKLLMNWAIAVIAATGFFLKLNVEKGIELHRRDLILAFLIMVLSVLSLFLGHLVMDRSAEMLSLDQFPMDNDTVRLLGRYQYVTGLTSVGLFAFHVFQFFWARMAPGRIS